MLGIGDVDFMDYNISYYTIGYLGLRPWLRGLYAYPAVVGKTTTQSCPTWRPRRRRSATTA